MTLTRLERATLYLQLEQLKNLKENGIASREDIESYQEALRYGYELHYKEILDLFYIHRDAVGTELKFRAGSHADVSMHRERQARLQ